MSYQWEKRGILPVISVETIMNLLLQYKITPEFVISMTTEKIEIKKTVEELTGLDKLLELRVFNAAEELKIWRDTVMNPCQYRVAVDEEWTKQSVRRILEEKQFLDIDDTRTRTDDGTTFVVSTGGGRYELPFANAKSIDTQIVINNYVDFYPETGQAYFADWRVAGFQMKGGNR